VRNSPWGGADCSRSKRQEGRRENEIARDLPVKAG